MKRDINFAMILGIAITTIGAYFLLKPKEATAAPRAFSVINKYKTSLIKLKIAGFDLVVDKFIKDMTDRNYITNVTCRKTGTLTKECSITVFQEASEIVYKSASLYGISWFV